MAAAWRATSQDIMPGRRGTDVEGYSIYPAQPMADGSIQAGFDSLATRLAGNHTVVIDGFAGVFWDDFQQKLRDAFERTGLATRWIDMRTCLHDQDTICRMIDPFLGGQDPLFGRAYTGELGDFFDLSVLDNPPEATDGLVTILYGTGAALAGWPGPLVYLDIPKSEIQFRARAGSIVNLGMTASVDHKLHYKQSYFVDWPVLNRHKQTLLDHIDVIVDAQRPDDPTHCTGDRFRETLRAMSRTVYRPRPWFEPGPWGGQWIKEHVEELPKDPPNYAWSFEYIAPENGILLENNGLLLEVSSDFLLFLDSAAILGESSERFGAEFPIRFDFLDTFDGGNLSVQVHPRPEYIQRHFGERFTQDETYYILDCRDGAEVFLGLQDDIDPKEFRNELERSAKDGTPVDIPKYVQTHGAQKHDLFLIPHGTIHCSGINNLVLEISATPYIFTFKMYDWLRLGLDGKPRPLNLDRAFENIYLDRKGARVRDEFISTPKELERGSGWRLLHLPTHVDHFYDVHRIELDDQAEVDLATMQSVQVMSVVDGRSVVVEVNGTRRRFSYAETFVVPAAAERFRLISDRGEAKVVMAFIKAGRGPR